MLVFSIKEWSSVAYVKESCEEIRELAENDSDDGALSWLHQWQVRGHVTCVCVSDNGDIDEVTE